MAKFLVAWAVAIGLTLLVIHWFGVGDMDNYALQPTRLWIGLAVGCVVTGAWAALDGVGRR